MIPILPGNILPGSREPLGATFDGSGTTFALYSEVAERVELCLFDSVGNERRVEMPRVDGHCFSGYAPGIGPGQRYGFRVHGPYDAQAGHRCNPNKLLIDPYARAVDGRVRWNDSLFGYDRGQGEAVLSASDSAAAVPKSLVIDNQFEWDADEPIRRPWQDTILYELHVKSFTAQHPAVPNELRGTFAGLAHPVVIEYFKELGITAVELMPIFHFEDEFFLHQRGMSNHWGYNPIALLAPHASYCSEKESGSQVREFKQMVQTLHKAGLEVILDVVYNHTAEGDLAGPTLSLRGIDNALYYRHQPQAPGRYLDFTGCGNTVNVPNPHVLKLVMDSLRYWVKEMHVDGFRFDLACTLGRGYQGFDAHGAFLSAVHQDPVLRDIKLIAEPWDLGDGGYQVGNFPWPWREWNGKFRDFFRDFWRGYAAFGGEMALRFSGSADLYGRGKRGPYTSVNLITAHDGFTLRDLVSYNEKHNDANGEQNRDGESYNRSWNCGAEGATEDVAVNALRSRQQRNLLATLILGQGVPLLLSGDEIGRSQGGNNNAYCQDNEISWLDWNNPDQELLRFVRSLIALRRSHPALRSSSWNWQSGASEQSPVTWFSTAGQAIDPDHPGDQPVPAVMAAFLSQNTDAPGQEDHLIVLFNSSQQPAHFTVPESLSETHWRVEVDTAGEQNSNDDLFELMGCSLRVMRSVHSRVGVIRSLLPV